jgi:hypothetical protein
MSQFDNFDWIRHPDGKIKKTPNGGYVMMNEVGCCYGFNLDKLDDFRKMFKEVEKQQCVDGNHVISSQRVSLTDKMGVPRPAQMCARCCKVSIIDG